MYYKIRGYLGDKSVGEYSCIAYNKREKNYLIKQYKEYLKSKELDMFSVSSYLNNGIIKNHYCILRSATR